VEIRSIQMHHYAPPEIGVEVVCSPGTYVRTLAADLGEVLGCGAHLSGLRRTRSGDFDLAQARPPEEFDALAEEGRLEAELIPPERALGWPCVRLSALQARRVLNGGDVPVAEARGEFETGTPPRPGNRLCALAPSGDLLAVVELRLDRRLHPLRVFGGG
jgi:tRNA pseudouridine55 synthase